MASLSSQLASPPCGRRISVGAGAELGQAHGTLVVARGWGMARFPHPAHGQPQESLLRIPPLPPLRDAHLSPP